MVKSAGNPIFLGNGAPKKFWPLLETLARTFFHNSLNEVYCTVPYSTGLDQYTPLVAVNLNQAINAWSFKQKVLWWAPQSQSVQHKCGPAAMRSFSMLLCSSEHAQKVFLVCKMQPAQ